MDAGLNRGPMVWQSRNVNNSSVHPRSYRFVPVIALLLVSALAVGCGGPHPLSKAELHESEVDQFPPTGREAEQSRESRLESVDIELEHDASPVPLTAAEESNPFRSEKGRLVETSISAGRDLFETHCTSCHGVAGFGDGELGTELEPAPADLHSAEVQHRSDGALAYLITNGIQDSSMQGFENTLSEDETWHVVTYVRTFGEYRSPALVR